MLVLECQAAGFPGQLQVRTVASALTARRADASASYYSDDADPRNWLGRRGAELASLTVIVERSAPVHHKAQSERPMVEAMKSSTRPGMSAAQGMLPNSRESLS
jgi:hypothetical protein